MKASISKLLFAASVTVPLSLFSPESQALTNGSFESGLAPWTFTTGNGAAATEFQDSSTAANGAYSEAIYVTKAVPGCAWCVSLRQAGTPLTAGQAVTITFSAKASAKRALEVGLQQNGGSWAWYSLQDFNISTSWAAYSFTFTPKASDANTLLNFDVGNSAGKVWIDNVRTTGGNAAFTVTPSATNATLSPSGPQSVASGAQPAFTVSARSGYSLSKTVGGTCAAGGWSGDVYTTGKISASCSISFSASALAPPVNGACGSANGVAVSSTPSGNLCGSGTASQVSTGNGLFTWTCAGANGGATASCSAPLLSSGTALSPPAGYSSSELIFEDKFTSAALDTTKWNPWLGDDVYGRWSDNGALPDPYSGMNCDSTCSNSYQVMYYDPYPYGYGTNISGNHLAGGNGNLALIAQPSSHFGNLGYSWSSAVVSSYGKAYLPAAGGYVQWRAKMPDSRYGAWGGLWLLSSGGAEMDIQESGYPLGSSNTNNILASHWQGSGGSQLIQDSGMDLSAAYHTYGIEYRPGQWWKVYLDGKLMATWTSGVPTGAEYQVLIDLEIGGPSSAGWHTVANPAVNPGPFELDVSDVQIYSLP